MTIENEKPLESVVERAPVEETQSPEYTEEEKVALSRGWKPKDQWEGPEDEWKPAKVFNQIGDLKDQISQKDKDLKKVNKVLEMVKTHHMNVRAAAKEDAIRELRAARAAALEDQDFGKAEKIRDQIDDIDRKFRSE